MDVVRARRGQRTKRDPQARSAIPNGSVLRPLPGRSNSSRRNDGERRHQSPCLARSTVSEGGQKRAAGRATMLSCGAHALLRNAKRCGTRCDRFEPEVSSCVWISLARDKQCAKSADTRRDAKRNRLPEVRCAAGPTQEERSLGSQRDPEWVRSSPLAGSIK